MADTSAERTKQLQQVLLQCRAYLQEGKKLEDSAVIAKFPALMPELAAELKKLRLVHNARLMAGMTGASPPVAGDAPTTAHGGNAPPRMPLDQPPLPVALVKEPVKVRYFGDYELLEELGRGGMGVVYKAKQVSLNRLVAIKMLLAGTMASEEEVKRFYSEAEAAGHLEHPHIVPIYEVGEHQGTHYFSMANVRGRSLQELLRDGPLPPKKAAAYLAKVADAIAYAHSQGVLHRDIKPHNILIDEQDEPRVTDFGLAKRTDLQSEMTHSGQILGTPSYMPPEQALGDRTHVGPSSDVYSLGATLYALVTGRPPFQGENATETLLQVISQEPVSLRLLNPKVDRDLETITLKAIEKQPARRYPTATALREDLNRFLTGHPIHARPVSAPERVWRWARRNPVVASLSGGIAALLLAVSLVSTAAYVRSARDATAKTKLAGEKSRLAESETAARRAAESQTKLANERLTKARRSQYVARLALVSAKLESDPSASIALLEDEEVCPPELRDFVWRFYHRLAQRDQVSWAGHSNKVTFLGFVPQQSTLCTASLDGTVKLWQVAEKRAIQSQDTTIPITCGIVFPDGRTIATGDAKGAVTLWNLPNLSRRSFKLFDGAVNDLAVTSDGSLVAGCSASEVVVCETNQGGVVQRHTAQTASFWSLAFGPDNRVLVAVGAGRNSKQISSVAELGRTPNVGVIQIYTGDKFSVVAQAPASQHGEFTDIAFLGKNNTILLLTSTRYVLKFDLEKYEFDSQALPTLATGLALATSPDGQQFATSTLLGLHRSIDTTRPPRLLDGYGTYHSSHGADRARFRRVLLWKAVGLDATSHLTVAEDITSLAYSGDQQLLATGSDKGQITVYGNRHVREWATLSPGTEPVRGVQFSADSQFLSSVSSSNISAWRLATLTSSNAPERKKIPRPTSERLNIRVDYVRSGEQVVTTRLLIGDQPTQRTVTLEGSQSVKSIAISPNQKWVAARRVLPEGNHTIDIWDVITGAKAYSLTIPDATHVDTIWIDSSRVVEVARKKNFFLISQLDASGKSGTLSELAVDSDIFVKVFLSPDRRTIAICHGDDVASGDGKQTFGEVILWDVDDGRERARLIGHRGSIWSLAFSPDSRLLATGGYDHAIKLWDMLTGAELVTLSGHRSTVLALDFSPDGKMLASGSYDHTIKLWAAPDPHEPMLPRGLLGLDATPFGLAEGATGLAQWGHSWAELMQLKTKVVEKGKLADDNPGNLAYRRDAARMWYAIAILEGNKGLGKLCIDSFQNALRHFDILAAKDGLDEELREQQALALMNLGSELNAHDRLDEALDCNQRAVEACRALVLESPDRHGFQSRLGGSLNNFAMTKFKQRDYAAARALIREAIALQLKARTAEPEVLQYTQFLTNHYFVLADVELAARNLSEFLNALEVLRDLSEGSVISYVKVVRLCSQALLLVNQRRTNPAADRPMLRVRLVEEAMRALQKSRELGVSDWGGLKGDDSFDALRQEPDFQNFLRDSQQTKNSTTVKAGQ